MTIDLERLSAAHAELGDPMRQGRKLGRTLYVGEQIAGMVDCSDFAGLIVDSVNALPALIAIARAALAWREQVTRTETCQCHIDTLDECALCARVRAFDAAVAILAEPR